MTVNDISKIVIGVIASVGGISAVIVIAVRFCVNIIAARLEEKYTLKLNKELERYKSLLEGKNYISKTKFDAEFEVYRELSKLFFDAVKNVSAMIPAGLAYTPADENARKEQDKQLFEAASKAVVGAQDALNGNVPFISKELYELYEDILKDCRLQLSVFRDRWIVSPSHKLGESTLEREDYERTRKLFTKLENVNGCVRDYIASLDVFE